MGVPFSCKTLRSPSQGQLDMEPLMVYLSGGLGNQLFQLSTGAGLKHRREIVLSTSQLSASGRREEIEPAAKALGIELTNEQCGSHHLGTACTDFDIATDLCCLWAFPRWLDWAYHNTNAPEFVESLECLIQTRGQESCSSVGDAIGLHLRLGDYLWPRHASRYGVLSLGYYEEASRLLQKNRPPSRTVIFAEDPRAARRLYRPLVDRASIVYGSGSPLDDLNRMALCRYLVAANSTLSLWAAWLSRQRSGRLNSIAPARVYRRQNVDLFVGVDTLEAPFRSPWALALGHPWTLTRRLVWQDCLWI